MSREGQTHYAEAQRERQFDRAPSDVAACAPCSASSWVICSTMARLRAIGGRQAVEMPAQMGFDLLLGLGDEPQAGFDPLVRPPMHQWQTSRHTKGG